MAVTILLESVNSYNPNANVDLIKRAYEFAERAHEGQKRASGEPFFEHAVEVAKILISLKLNSTTIAAGLLHDVIEDTKIRLKTLEEEFGQEIAGLVEGVTKLDRISLETSDEEKAQNIRKILLATMKDVRVILIKLADRLHNMRTLKFLSKDKQIRIATETMEIYAPIAHKLGIYKIKSELEDLSLRYLNPDVYENLKSLITEKKTEREAKILEIIQVLVEKLKEHNIPGLVTGRAKTFYSIYKKIKRKGVKVDNIYDLHAFRIITDNIENCYKILGIIHSTWHYMKSEFDDYIANPKPNGYQSIHTKIIYNGKPIEVQIRTEEMHLEAEEGIAAHWRYKGTERDKKFDRKIAWLRQILEWERSSDTARDLIETLKIDLFKDEIIVFTPKGEPIALPEDSTPIDFAYEIHSSIGDKCVRAKVNNLLVSLDHRLNSGDVVEIQTSSNAKPSRQWLGFARTSHARSKIRQSLGIQGERFIKRTKEDQSILDQVSVEGYENPDIKFSKCCKPQLGETVYGFKTKDGKITVHSLSCPNINSFDQSKIVNVRWKMSPAGNLLAKRINIAVRDRVGILSEILNMLARDKINLTSINSKSSKDHVIVTLDIEVKSEEALENLVERIKYVPDVIDVIAMDI